MLTLWLLVMFPVVIMPAGFITTRMLLTSKGLMNCDHSGGDGSSHKVGCCAVQVSTTVPVNKGLWADTGCRGPRKAVCAPIGADINPWIFC